MRILVCISKVPDTTSAISFSEDKKKFKSEGITYIINPADEWYALVRALELKEATGAHVTLINVGLAENEAILRKAVSIGGDDCVRIDAEPTNSLFVASQIANYAKANNYDLIFCGKETIDYNGFEVPGMIAELMDVAYVSLATKLDMTGNTATIERDVEGGVEVVSVDLPLVISAAKGMAEQRIPNMKGIMAARTKPMQIVTPSELPNTIEVVSYEMAPAKKGVKMIQPDQMDELVRLLHEEAKVI